MKQHILSSYVSRKGGENKAPVVLDDVGLREDEMKKPEVAGYVTVDEILDITSWKREEIIPYINGRISIVTTGLKDAIIEVVKLNVLKRWESKENMIDFCKRKGIVGAHVVSRETLEPDSDFACRNFAPAVGIDKESVIGTSNGSLVYYIKSQAVNKVNKKRLK